MRRGDFGRAVRSFCTSNRIRLIGWMDLTSSSSLLITGGVRRQPDEVDVEVSVSSLRPN